MPSLLSKTCDSNAKPLLGFSNAKNFLCTDNSNLRMSNWEHALEFSLVGKDKASLCTKAARMPRTDWIWCYDPNTCLQLLGKFQRFPVKYSILLCALTYPTRDKGKLKYVSEDRPRSMQTQNLKATYLEIYDEIQDTVGCFFFFLFLTNVYH